MSAIARIGPNALIQVAETLKARLGQEVCRRVFASAGLLDCVDAPPTAMVDETSVTRLHAMLRDGLGTPAAMTIAAEAGRRTGDYLLANRIPHLVQRVLRVMPPFVASRVLLAAIGRNSWTFVGSGTLTISPGNPVILRVQNCPLCRGAAADQTLCAFYAATFQRLFQVIVSHKATVRETACQALGHPSCMFRIDW